MILEQDTLFYRHDHPRGFLFTAGNEAPEGWFAAPEDIPVEPQPTYECTSYEAFAELLRTERQAATQMAEELRTTLQRLAAATGVIAALQAENATLNEQLAAREA